MKLNVCSSETVLQKAGGNLSKLLGKNSSLKCMIFINVYVKLLLSLLLALFYSCKKKQNKKTTTNNNKQPASLMTVSVWLLILHLSQKYPKVASISRSTVPLKTICDQHNWVSTCSEGRMPPNPWIISLDNLPFKQ